jgi:hypothetical protein
MNWGGDCVAARKFNIIENVRQWQQQQKNYWLNGSSIRKAF